MIKDKQKAQWGGVRVKKKTNYLILFLKLFLKLNSGLGWHEIDLLFCLFGICLNSRLRLIFKLFSSLNFQLQDFRRPSKLKTQKTNTNNVGSSNFQILNDNFQTNSLTSILFLFYFILTKTAESNRERSTTTFELF